MELRQVKSNLVASHELLIHAVEEIYARVNKTHTRMAEEDLLTLRQLVIDNIMQIEKADGLIWSYGRVEFGEKLFAPTARRVPYKRIVDETVINQN